MKVFKEYQNYNKLYDDVLASVNSDEHLDEHLSYYFDDMNLRIDSDNGLDITVHNYDAYEKLMAVNKETNFTLLEQWGSSLEFKQNKPDVAILQNLLVKASWYFRYKQASCSNELHFYLVDTQGNGGHYFPCESEECQPQEEELDNE